MMAFKAILFLSLIFIIGCSGGNGGNSLSSSLGGDINPTSEATPPPMPDPLPSEVETVKLQAAIQTQPEYKIDNAEIETLKAEGIISEEDVSKIQAIQ